MFDIYPKILYNNSNIIDISKRFVITNIETNFTKPIFFWHTIKGWKSPENVAYDFYGSCDYVWILFVLNNVVHPIDDWLLSDEELRQRIEKKYGLNAHKVHHYERDGILYASKEGLEDTNGLTFMTNYEYEVEQNERKRKIKVLYPYLLSTIEQEVRKLFK